MGTSRDLANLTSLPDGWRMVQLGEIADVAFSPVDKKTVDGETATRLCNYTDVFYSRRISLEMDFMAATATQLEIDRWALKRGDVLFTKDSETPDEIGIPAYVAQDMPNVLCGYHLGLARPNNKLVEGAYLAEALTSPRSASEFRRIASGVTRFGLTLPGTQAIHIPLPPLSEQRGIAAVLDSIDEAIEREEAVVAATERLRDVMLHELLTRGIPGRHTEWQEAPGLGTIPAGWEVKTLGDTLLLDQPGAWGDAPTSDAPGVRVLRAADLTRDGRVDPTNAAWRRLPERDLEKRLLQDGDIILERSGGGPGTPVGRVALIQGLGAVYCSNFCQQMRVDQRKVRPTYMIRALWHRYLRGVTARLEYQTTGIRNLDYSVYLDYPVPLPPPSEQDAIAEALDAVDLTINHLEGRTNALRLLKASAAEALLTGKVRVNRR